LRTDFFPVNISRRADEFYLFSFSRNTDGQKKNIRIGLQNIMLEILTGKKNLRARHNTARRKKQSAKKCSFTKNRKLDKENGRQEIGPILHTLNIDFVPSLMCNNIQILTGSEVNIIRLLTDPAARCCLLLTLE
jgi:hypothetical protein